MRAFVAKVNVSTASADTEYRAVFTTLYLTFFELPSIRQLHGAGLQLGDARLQLLAVVCYATALSFPVGFHTLRLLQRLYQRINVASGTKGKLSD
ncbi:TPA: hypothetical protein ACN7G7_002019 [Klebsiella pneumoniae]